MTPFIEDMAGAYAGADLIVSRSGAGAVAEIAAAGRPAILVPFPFAADDHQRHNAEALERAGAAIVVPEEGLTGERLGEAVVALARDPGRRAADGPLRAQPGRGPAGRNGPRMCWRRSPPRVDAERESAETIRVRDVG